MAVSTSYKSFVLEQLSRVRPVTARAMFGGVGLHRADFEQLGMAAFQPYGDGSYKMRYHALPPDLLEEPDSLRPWIEKAIAMARRKKR